MKFHIVNNDSYIQSLRKIINQQNNETLNLHGLNDSFH